MNILKAAIKYTLKVMMWSFAAVGVCTFYLLNAFDVILLTYVLVVYAVCIIIAYRKNKTAEKKIVTALTPNCCVENYHT
jgi:hypothetical protein